VKKLKRTLNFPLLLLYGLGTILGAGIYVLTGVVVAEAGEAAPIAFFLAALVAAPTAYSYSILSAKYPQSAGEAVYVDNGFKLRPLTQFVGVLVVSVGMISAATMATGFVGYLNVFIDLPILIVIPVLVIALTGLAIYGVLESVLVAGLIAILEVVGLLLVVYGGIAQGEMKSVAVFPTMDHASLIGVLTGAFLAFYAFIGFEDIVNMAEETINPERNVPMAILGSLGLAAILYFLVTYIAVASVPIDELANHPAPMAFIVETHGVFNMNVMAVISMLAVVNGALVQIIMASRVIYGVARLRNEDHFFARVNEVTQTPTVATGVVGVGILALALTFDLRELATLTSVVTLAVFLLVNLSLCKIQGLPDSLVKCLPWLAAILNIALLAVALNSF
jgi:APA family basic amino acid/polyamine antiporter